MFGLSFSELVVVLVVAIVVIGPRDMPKLLRKVGQYAGKLRRMAADLRAQSGIDDVLRTEGLGESVAEIRKLARGELDHIAREVEYRPSAASTLAATSAIAAYDPTGLTREYPTGGPDHYGALPEHSHVYNDDFPKSALARDPLYVLGDADGVLPPEPVATASEAVDAVTDTPAPDAPAPAPGAVQSTATTAATAATAPESSVATSPEAT